MGKTASVPEKVGGGASFTPRIIETLIVALGLLLVGFMLLAQFNAIPFYYPNILTKMFCIVFTFVFFLRAIGDFKYLGFTKRIKDSTFAKYDTRYYSPLCFYLGISFLLVWL
ncbi:DUF3995 domain-containing protein [Gracilibacillus salitolerans]|uniref:DUF3995 domain-containing protein n=1 Tax=Gracilibacillus salitolerans TaxID=2663022 RepID=A0A5Q2TGZ1_9BACI|nr:DUF3995 domain-containing protein [Gracilibacillus salitolerans]QGH33915.1 DUF3995 domain-containing protein [Gracilibacillus salitolerans]